MAIFNAFRRYIFGTFGDKAKLLNYNMQKILLKTVLSEPNIDDPVWSFYVKFCFRAGVFRTLLRGFPSLAILHLWWMLANFKPK